MDTPPSAGALAGQVQAVRAFSRFYTQRISMLDRYLGGELSLTEMRILWELANRAPLTASELARELVIDAGFLSRLLRRFETRGWIERRRVPQDARRALLSLTRAGHAVYEPLAQRTSGEIAAMLASLPEAERPELLATMARLHRLLLPQAQRPPRQAADAVLREPQPGDIGWVIEQHGALYWQEQGYGAPFEALAAELCARFLGTRDPQRERAWIAEHEGRRLGCVFLMRKSATVGQLRMLLVAPEGRGFGLGGRLVDECIAFGRAAGYRKLVLWTLRHLTGARSLYASRGWQRTASERTTEFGRRVVAETWELKL
jgi:DNA-binding MarR family transcriptional regulator/N-acetylglutamate synthase-like GNAT family acetyltransferase